MSTLSDDPTSTSALPASLPSRSNTVQRDRTLPIAIHWCGPQEGCWQWVLDHFCNASFLREKDLQHWWVEQATNCSERSPESQFLILVAHDRSDRLLHLASQVEQAQLPSASTIPWCALLGTDWSGHRRTKPLPDSWNVFYWHELYDRLLPWLKLNHRQQGTTVSASCIVSSGSRRVSARVQRWIETTSSIQNLKSSSIKMALVVAETQSTRELWLDTLSRRGIACVAISPDQELPWMTPSCVILDIESTPLVVENRNSQGNLEASLRIAEKAYPSAIRVAIDPFPRWEKWTHFMAAGADMVVGKPYDVVGMIDSIESVLTLGSITRSVKGTLA